MSDAKQLQQKLDLNSYPANQCYDVKTLEPLNDVTRARVKHIKECLPELLAGGKSFLDIGCNKGFIPMLCSDVYDEIHGYERSYDTYEIAEGVRQLHNRKNIKFFNKGFRDIDICKFYNRKYEVVYCGSVHHHFFKDCILHGAPGHLALRKLIAITDKYLILDGPFEFEGDCSLTTWEEEYKWGPEIRKSYTMDAHLKWLSPQFEMVRCVDNERGRKTAVFKRVKPDMPYRSVYDIPASDSEGAVLRDTNCAREKGSIYSIDGLRYKYDKNPQPDGIFQILNHIPEYFAKTTSILEMDGKKVGDEALWIDGKSVGSPETLWVHWLKMNNVLASIGLVEPHFKPDDYKYNKDTKTIVDVDVDMVWSTITLVKNDNYIGKWVETKKKLLGSKYHEALEFFHKNFNNEFVFKRMIEMKAGK